MTNKIEFIALTSPDLKSKFVVDKAKIFYKTDLCEIFGCKTRSLQDIIKQPDFPAPLGKDGAFHVWDSKAISDWLDFRKANFSC